jgi:NADPH:quinone reductase-like Zn-dependent oxidoreductase
MPENTAAWLQARQAPLEVRSAPYPQPREGEIVVRNHAVAINPVDWGIQLLGRLLFSWINYPCILGGDLAGEVVEVGKGVTRFSVGDRVLGLAVGTDKARNSSAEGSFQEYTVILAHLAAPIPDTMSYESACVLPLTLSTAACGLFQKDHLALQYPAQTPQPTGKTLLIWGGSTSVGSNAIQLAVAAGYEVITTASPRNFDYVRQLGASQVFDYKRKGVVNDIKEAFKGKTCAGALAIGAGSADPCSAIVSASHGSKFVSLAGPPVSFGIPTSLPPGLSLQLLRLILRLVVESISIQMKFWVRRIHTKFIFGSTLMYNEVSKVIYEDFLPQALADGRYIAAPEPVVVGEGLDHIQAALDLQRQGVSAKKVVISL